MATKHDIEIGIGFKVDKTGLDSLKSQLQGIQNMRVSDMVKINSNDAVGKLRKIKDMAAQVEVALDKSFNKRLGSLNVAEFQKQLGSLSLQDVYNGFDQMGAKGRSDFRNLTAVILGSN